MKARRCWRKFGFEGERARRQRSTIKQSEQDCRAGGLADEGGDIGEGVGCRHRRHHSVKAVGLVLPRQKHLAQHRG